MAFVAVLDFLYCSFRIRALSSSTHSISISISMFNRLLPSFLPFSSSSHSQDYTTSVHRDRLTQLPQVSVQAYNSALEYLAKICPKKDLFSHELPGEVERPPETLADRIKALLISAHVVSFDHVCIIVSFC